jgi:hypothetical protein
VQFEFFSADDFLSRPDAFGDGLDDGGELTGVEQRSSGVVKKPLLLSSTHLFTLNLITRIGISS